MIDHAVLLALVHVPFLSLTNATLLLDAPPASIARAARRLRASGLVERVPLGGDKTMLHCLTDDGVIYVARGEGMSPDALALSYGLGRHALLARLPALARTLDAQDAFAPLVRALVEAADVAVVDYRLGALRWGDSSCGTFALDGQVTLETSAGLRTVGLLWDGDETVPMCVPRDLLRQVEETGRHTPIPPVLVVTHAPERMPWPYPSGILWTTVAELDAHSYVQARWVLPTTWGMGMRDKPAEEKPLLAATAALPCRYRADPPLMSAPYRPRAGRRLNLEGRLTALRQGGVEPKPTPPRLLALALPPRALYALQAVGQHPLLRTPQLAEVCDYPPARMRATLAWLAAHRLAEPNECEGERAGRYVLTRRGLRLLAAQVDLPVAAYREAYGVLEDTDEGTQRGLDFAAANLAHTTALQDVFFVFLRTARARGGSLSWHWEWACTRTFEWEGERCLLRPDADVIYEECGHRLHLFVELDRSTRSLADIEDQLRRYHRYAQATADMGMHQESGKALVTVAYVTTKSDKRARNIIATANDLSATEGHHAIRIRVLTTSLKRLMRRGPLERIWWRSGATGLATLFQERPGTSPKGRGMDQEISARKFVE